jgi:hypothetical protein
MREKCFNLDPTPLDRMPLVVEEDVAANPLHIGFFRAIGVVFQLDNISHLI